MQRRESFQVTTAAAGLAARDVSESEISVQPDRQLAEPDDKSVGILVHLSAEQAETLAVDLLEQAHAAMRER